MLKKEKNKQTATSTSPQNKEMADKLLEQLHEQYAINNNANLSSIVTLIAAVIVVFGGYGYLYINSIPVFSEEFFNLYNRKEGCFYFDALVLAFCSSVAVMAILWCICVYQGVTQRKEQFITDAIRHATLGDDLNSQTYIFPRGYHPYGKENFKIVQGIYGELARHMKWIGILLAVSFFFKFFIHICLYCQNIYSKIGFWEIVFTIIFTVAILMECHSIYKNYLESYNEREKEFLEKRPNDIHNDIL